MVKDQLVGLSIFLVCVAVTIGYLIGLLLFPSLQFFLIAIPVVIAFVAVLAIGAWIGWTMATTPAPKPIDEMDEGIRDEPAPP
jgi:uncharacterized membrane protein